MHTHWKGGMRKVLKEQKWWIPGALSSISETKVANSKSEQDNLWCFTKNYRQNFQRNFKWKLSFLPSYSCSMCLWLSFERRGKISSGSLTASSHRKAVGGLWISDSQSQILLNVEPPGWEAVYLTLLVAEKRRWGWLLKMVPHVWPCFGLLASSLDHGGHWPPSAVAKQHKEENQALYLRKWNNLCGKCSRSFIAFCI